MYGKPSFLRKPKTFLLEQTVILLNIVLENTLIISRRIFPDVYSHEGVMPLPLHAIHSPLIRLITGRLLFFLVSCISPSSVMPTTVVFILSFLTAACSLFVSCCRLFSSFISIKSIIIIPDKFLSLICDAISSAASRFVFKNVS